MELHTDHGADALSLRCDLHTHSVFSDGTYTPAEIIAESKRLGLIVALTDHNTVGGLPDFMEAAREQGVTAVPGIEFSTEYEGKELHLLGLFIRPEHYAPINDLLRQSQTLKEQCNRDLVARLNRTGYLMDFDEIKKRIPGGNLNRAHIAAELLARGYVSSIQAAFDTLLSDKAGFYVPPPQLPIMDIIRALRRMGALPVLAHPLQELTEQELRTLLPTAKAAGLLGMETVHSSYSPETIRLAESIAAEFELLSSGGSDFHGSVKPDISLGTGKGWLSIPSGIYAELLSARDALQH